MPGSWELVGWKAGELGAGELGTGELESQGAGELGGREGGSRGAGRPGSISLVLEGVRARKIDFLLFFVRLVVFQCFFWRF